MGEITIPGPGDEIRDSLILNDGGVGMLFAADTAEVSRRGHGGDFPGVTETIFLQVPTGDGEVPEHEVLYVGACGAEEYAGLRDGGAVVEEEGGRGGRRGRGGKWGWV